MSSTIRERAAARARLERQMAEKLESARKRKQRLTIIGAAAAALLVAGGVIWAIASIDPEKEPESTAADPNVCIWTPDDASVNPNLKDVGTPPTGVAPHTGTQTMTMTMNIGVVEVQVDTANAPCAARSMTYLAEKKFFDNTKCHRLVTEGIRVLQCGDPTGTSSGGPTYKFGEENLPDFIDMTKNYPSGTIAMAKAQQPGTTGSQFFIVWGETQLSGDYTVLGKITKGLELIQEKAKAGVKPAADGTATPDGEPVNEFLIQTLTMSAPQA